MGITRGLVGRVPTRKALSRSAVLLGVLLLAAGLCGAWYAGRGLRSTHLRVAGVPVELVRPVDGGAGRPAVVIAHGYAGSGRLMRPFADTLARRGYVVALPDLAGHAGNTRPLIVPDWIDLELAEVVRYVRGLADVDPGRVALLGHSMGAAAVVRVGAADPSIAATVAISLGDDAAAALRPGPRRLLLMVGALEPPAMRAVADRALAVAADERRAIRVPLAEHVGVLYAGRTHREAARWLDDAVRHRSDRPVVTGTWRVGAGGLSLAGGLLLVAATLLAATSVTATSVTASPARPSGSEASVPSGSQALVWPVGAAAVASVTGLLGGWSLARVLPSEVCGYLVGYFGLAGATLAGAALVAHAHRRDGHGGYRRDAGGVWSAAGSTIALAIGAGAAVVVPVHVGLTSAVPHGPHWWLLALLALATATLLAGAQAVARPPWSVAVLVAVCLPLPVAAVVGLAPGFLLIITPLVAALFAAYLLVAGAAWLAGLPWWRAVPAGAVMVAWPVATALPIG